MTIDDVRNSADPVQDLVDTVRVFQVMPGELSRRFPFLAFAGSGVACPMGSRGSSAAAAAAAAGSGSDLDYLQSLMEEPGVR